MLLTAPGRFEEAKASVTRAESLVPGDPLMTLGTAGVFAHAGDRPAAQERVERRVALWEEGTAVVSPGGIAWVYASLGEADHFFVSLNRAVDAYDSWIHSLH